MPAGRAPARASRPLRPPRAAAAPSAPRGRVTRSPRAVQHELAALDMLALQLGTPTVQTGNEAAPGARAQSPVSPFPGEESILEDPCSVGLSLKRQMMDAEFVVELINKDGPIDATGRVRVGDKVVEVDGVAVEGKSFGEVCKMLRGADGSFAHIIFERDVEGSRLCYNISVQRTPERNFSCVSQSVNSPRLRDRKTDNADSRLPISAEQRVIPPSVFSGECSGAETSLTRRGGVYEESLDSDGISCCSLLLWASVYVCLSALSFCISAKVNTEAGFEDWPEIGDWSVAVAPCGYSTSSGCPCSARSCDVALLSGGTALGTRRCTAQASVWRWPTGIFSLEALASCSC